MRIKLETKIKILSEASDLTANVKDVAAKFQVNVKSVYKILSDNGIYRPKKYNTNIKYPFDHSFFLNEKDIKTAYFYGFVLGDGCLQQSEKLSSYMISIQLHKKDVNILKMFCDWTNKDQIAIRYTKNDGVVLRYQDKELFYNNDFSKWGIIPNKTYNPVIPSIDNSVIKPFLLGLIDADGSVKFDKEDKYFQLAGNKTIITWFIRTIKKLGFKGKTSTRFYQNNNVKFGRVQIRNSDDVVSLGKILEIDKFDFILDRKWGNLKKILNNYVPKISIAKRKNPDNHKSKHHNAGISNGQSKLTENDVSEIKKLLRAGEYQADIAKKYNVGKLTINSINTGKRWRHIK